MLGSYIMLAGLAVQLLCFIIFTALAIWVRRHPKNGIAGTPQLKQLYTGLYLNIFFLFVRNTFRFVEFTQSIVIGYPPEPGTYVLSEQEVLFYTLDTLPILLCFLAILVWHPGWYLPQPAPTEVQPGLAKGKGSAELEGNSSLEEEAQVAGAV